MPPALFTRSAHHSVARSPAVPTGAAMPARMATTPSFTGSPWACAGGTSRRSPADAAAAVSPRNSRREVFIASSLLHEPEVFARELRARDQALELLEGDPARHREEAAVRHRGEALDGDGLRAERQPLGDILRRLHVEGLHVDDAAGHVAVDADLLPVLDLGHLAVRVLEHELLALRV